MEEYYKVRILLDKKHVAFEEELPFVCYPVGSYCTKEIKFETKTPGHTSIQIFIEGAWRTLETGRRLLMPGDIYTISAGREGWKYPMLDDDE